MFKLNLTIILKHNCYPLLLCQSLANFVIAFKYINLMDEPMGFPKKKLLESNWVHEAHQVLNFFQ
jgi:hypothetical protein